MSRQHAQYIDKQHVSVPDLKRYWYNRIENGYLYKNIDEYPDFEFQIKKVAHVTGEHGLEGIFNDSGFKLSLDTLSSDHPKLLWWDLSITDEEKSSAKELFLKSLFPYASDDQIWNQLPILECFTTSKAFQKESCYGNFRFTFSLKELLWHYGVQFCDDLNPVLRVYKTMIYQKEIVYAVIVHPPNIDLYDNYPRLPSSSDDVCGYRNGSMWWRCQSPSETYKHELMVNWADCSVSVSPHRKEYYVWDHVCVAFHMEPGWVLHVEKEKLLNRVSVCEMVKPYLLRPPDTPLSVDEAESILTDLKARMD